LLDALDAEGLPYDLGAGANGPDFPVGRFVLVSPGVDQIDGLHVGTPGVHYLPIDGRPGAGGWGRGRIGAGVDADDVDEVDAGVFVTRGAYVEREPAVGHGDGVGGEEWCVAIGDGVEEVGPLDVDRVDAVVIGWVSHGDGHLVRAIGELEF